MEAVEAVLTRAAAAPSAGREDMWVEIFASLRPREFLELGVLRGRFAERILRSCQSITRYYMLDPWRHLEGWNKPSNNDQPEFDAIFSEAMARTEFAQARRIVLRGKTTEVIEKIPDASLDVAYVDGDHTLRGIAIDLICTYPKVRPGGLLTGDDYTPTIWQHGDNFEPTLVCPFAAYFAESIDAPIFLLPHDQFAMIKPPETGTHFRVVDTNNRYGERALLPQITRRT
jgi:hypothetical protein